MDQARSLLLFIVTYASSWAYDYIQNGYAQARLGGANLPDVSPSAADMLAVLEESANLSPLGRLGYAQQLAKSAKLDKQANLSGANSQVRQAAAALGAGIDSLPDQDLNSLLGFVEQSRTPTSSLRQAQGFSFNPEGENKVIVTDNGKNSKPEDKPKGGFWDETDFDSVSDLLLGLGGIASSILAGKQYNPNQQGFPQNTQGQPAAPAPVQQGNGFIRTALIVAATIGLVLMGVIAYKRLKS